MKTKIGKCEGCGKVRELTRVGTRSRATNCDECRKMFDEIQVRNNLDDKAALRRKASRRVYGGLKNMEHKSQGQSQGQY